MLTRHAQKRAQQRAIHRKRGLDLIYFDKLGKRSAQSLMKKIGLKQSDHYLKVFLLESSDGDIVTVGHRTKRINRN